MDRYFQNNIKFIVTRSSRLSSLLFGHLISTLYLSVHHGSFILSLSCRALRASHRLHDLGRGVPVRGPVPPGAPTPVLLVPDAHRPRDPTAQRHQQPRLRIRGQHLCPVQWLWLVSSGLENASPNVNSFIPHVSLGNAWRLPSIRPFGTRPTQYWVPPREWLLPPSMDPYSWLAVGVSLAS